MTSVKASLQKRVASLGATAFRHYKRELHRYLLRRLRQPQDVDDLAQEVYLRLLRVDETQAVRHPLAYLYGVASNVVADFRIGADHEREHLMIDSEAVAKWSEGPAAVLPDDLADRLNLQQQIARALRQLPANHAAVLLAHKRDGMSYEEVAVKLGLSVNTVEKYITQAKARIRTMPWER